MEAISTTKLGGDKEIMKCPLIIDGRNIYEAQDMVNLGFDYVCIGR